MDMHLVIAAGVAALSLMLIRAWRRGGRYGKIMSSKDVAEAYEQYRVNPVQNYYISGSDACPNAIIGIDKRWTLESGLWKRRDLDASKLKELVQRMQSAGGGLNVPHGFEVVQRMQSAGGGLNVPHGFAIYDNRGNTIGGLFSILGLTMTVEITGENKVIVYSPPILRYRHY